MPSSWTQNYYHLVFSTKHREPLITEELHERLYPYIGGILRSERAQLLAGNGMPDHCHCLIRFPADMAPSNLAKEVKARSSEWIHQTFPNLRNLYWQRGYGGFTVSKCLAGEIEHYIRTQQEHHKTVTFEAEFLALLDENGVEYDRRYVFE
jgi:putative transposase